MAQARPAAIDRVSDRSFFVFNAVVSVLALAFIGYILILREAEALGGVDLRFLPAVNATLNGLSAVLLCAGWIAIRRRAIRVHKRLMVAAFATSAVFLVSYLVYHYVHGDTKYVGVGWLRAVYFAVLVSHVVLSMFVVPMALSAFYFAWRRQFQRHRRLTRIALPVWLYVSVTGVLIYFMLRGSGAAAAP
jgi:putative membrane protein